ncbi:hypothetical protein CCH79_00020476 [Gambusia affinis]|uniref:Protein kinase domain-containing protein n=1 Tax=Gambusia affinis TaxID=33528 RepID=A0A315W4E2_GAMAF|nr:hypothetical protein CCH79_00020476 [Gambusia affinis]
MTRSGSAPDHVERAVLVLSLSGTSSSSSLVPAPLSLPGLIVGRVGMAFHGAGRQTVCGDLFPGSDLGHKFFCVPSPAEMEPDRPIGYGAFGVVWSVTDPRDGRKVALKKMPNVFQNLVSCKRVFRELRMLCFFKHDNVLSALDILQPPQIDCFEEMYPSGGSDPL